MKRTKQPPRRAAPPSARSREEKTTKQPPRRVAPPGPRAGEEWAARQPPRRAAPSPARAGEEKTAQERREEWRQLLQSAKEWARIHWRRLAHVIHGAAVSRRAVGPVSFLGVSAALGLAFTLTTLYTTSYAVTVDGMPVGVVADQSVVTRAIQEVEEQGSELLGYSYQVESQVDYEFELSLKTELTDRREIESYFFSQLDEEGELLRKCQVTVDGDVVGVVKDEESLNRMLEELKSRYATENTVEAGFVEELEVEHIYVADELMTIEELKAALTANTTGETTYTVEKGNTFNAIAYANDMSVSDLKALNPDVDINRLMVGQVLNVKEIIPFMSVQTIDHETYAQAIECPVETVEDSSMYKGDSKILTQGEEGEALIEANVTYVNGYEREREILTSTTLKEPTTTVKAVGTKERPRTASTGSYAWPIQGRINSYFGNRYIFGSYSYHSGLDINASYGAAIKAADGGTVTFAGWRGSYGNLVIITHDNGTQTYYAHNSSLVVSSGQKVYKGQTVAKAGSTGVSTGVHCHFEIRINNVAVNPLNYLR